MGAPLGRSFAKDKARSHLEELLRKSSWAEVFCPEDHLKTATSDQLKTELVRAFLLGFVSSDQTDSGGE